MLKQELSLTFKLTFSELLLLFQHGKDWFYIKYHCQIDMCQCESVCNERVFVSLGVKAVNIIAYQDDLAYLNCQGNLYFYLIKKPYSI